MGDKGSKIAAKQAELSRRKRRDKQPSIPAGTVVQPQADASTEGTNTSPASSGAQPAQSAPMPRPAARPFIVRRGKGAPEVAPAYPYLNRELRNIAIVMTGLAAILIALTFVLR
jgi:hypothetical protein